MSEKYIAKTFFGLEEMLAEEIRKLGGQLVEPINRAVAFTADLETLYKVNLSSRTALRVLQPILEFSAHNETVYYKRLRRFKWWDLFSLDQTFAIDVTAHSSKFTHSQFLALKAKDAIVDLFRHKFNNRRPSIELTNPDIRLHVHCRETNFTVSIDASGQSLHRRGHRAKSAKAPLNEALASGMLMLAGWDQFATLYDPMCGSGTIVLEAAQMAMNYPPRAHWTEFAFQKWKNYDDVLWRKVRNQALDKRIMSPQVMIYGTEKEASEVRNINKQLSSLGLEKAANVREGNFFESAPPATDGLIITNPPYGHRLEQKNIDEFYKRIGDRLKTSYDGWQAWILSGNLEALKRLGLRTSRRLTLYNGPLECKFHRYDLYRGSRKRS